MKRYRKTTHKKAFVLIVLVLFGHGTPQEAPLSTSSSKIKSTEEADAASSTQSYKGTFEEFETATSSSNNVGTTEMTVSGLPENIAGPENSFVSNTPRNAAIPEETSMASKHTSIPALQKTLLPNLSKSTDESPWSRLPNNTGDYCPGANVCFWNNSNDINDIKLPNVNVIPCCKDCSCNNATCGNESNCCFPELNHYQSVDRSFQTCTHLFTPVGMNSISVYKSFYVVDKNPLGGCVGAKQDLADEECGSINVAPWGSLLPAFSNGKLYKNIRCAECHGATDAEVLPVVQNCLKKDSIMGISAQTFMGLPAVSERECYVYFEYQMFKEQLKQERCYNGVIHYCNSIFKIPEGVELTKNEIEEACTSGFYSPYPTSREVYANVFCHMCNVPKFYAGSVCADQRDRRGCTKSTFSVLLDLKVVAQLQNSPTRTVPLYKKLACIPHKGKIY